jgi:hypothetical protein
VIKFRDGFVAPAGITPETTHEELCRIADRDGGITARAVVDDAKPEKAPLHKAFEWEDAVAGDHWRLHQASNLTRAVVVIHVDAEPTREFINVSPMREPAVYQPRAVIVESPVMLEAVRSDALSRISSVRRIVEDTINLLADAPELEHDMEIPQRVLDSLSIWRTALQNALA